MSHFYFDLMFPVVIHLDLFQLSEVDTNLPLLERVCGPDTLILSLLLFSHRPRKQSWLSDHLEVVFSSAAGLERGGLAGWAVLGEDKVSSPPVHV